MAVTKNLNLKITADARDAEKGFKKASAASDRFGRSVSKMPGGKHFSSIGKGALGAAAGFGAIAIAGNEISKSISTTMGLAKATRTLQRATGLAAEDASQLAAVLQQRGIDATKSGRAFTTLARQTRAAADGSESASKMFKELGVSQAAIKSGDVTAILTQASDGFNRLGDGQAKAAIAQQLFGKGAKDIIPLLEGGSKALREQLGLAPQMSQAQVTASLKMVGAQREINTAMMAVRVTLGTALMPILSKGATDVAKFVTQMRTGKGAGGEFAAKLKAIYESAKPALKTLLDVAKAVFNFAANNPGVVKLVASLAAVGLAVKAIRFTSKLTGIGEFLGAGRTAMKAFKGIFARVGAQAGSSAMTSAAASAADQAAAGVMTAGGRGARFKGSGKALGKIIGKGIAGGVIAGIIVFGPDLAKAVNRWFQDNVPDVIKKLLNFGLGGGSPFGDPGPIKGVGASSRKGATAKGASNVRAAAGNQYAGFLPDPLTGGPGLEPQLVDAEKRAAKLQGQLESAITKAGSKITASEKKRINELKNLVRGANTAVAGLQTKMGRRDALLEVRDQMRSFVDDAVSAYGAGLEKIAQTSFDNANKSAQGELNAALKSFDEQYGNSPQAVRLRELRAQQETDARAGQDKVYSDERADLEAQLSRAIRNGRTAQQRELNAQILVLDTARADVLRQREIDALSASLQSERDNATNVYQAKVDGAEAAYNKAVEVNGELVANYQTSLNQQTAALLSQLEGNKISYKAYIDALNAMGAGLVPPVVGSPSVEAPIGQPKPAPAPAPAPSKGPFGQQVVNWVKANVKAGSKAKPTHTTATKVAAGLGAGATKAQVIAAGLDPKKDSVGKALLASGRIVDRKVSGGVLRAGALTLVGETGPELIMGGKVSSATRTASMGTQGGMNITINATGAAANDPALLARELGWQLSTR